LETLADAVRDPRALTTGRGHEREVAWLMSRIGACVGGGRSVSCCRETTATE